MECEDSLVDNLHLFLGTSKTFLSRIYPPTKYCCKLMEAFYPSNLSTWITASWPWMKLWITPPPGRRTPTTPPAAWSIPLPWWWSPCPLLATSPLICSLMMMMMMILWRSFCRNKNCYGLVKNVKLSNGLVLLYLFIFYWFVYCSHYIWTDKSVVCVCVCVRACQICSTYFPNAFYRPF